MSAEAALAAEPPRTEARPAAAWTTLALAVVTLGGWLIRASPLFRASGPLGVPIDYDEGVYFSASALLFQGVLPYRDFVFVHPPGLLYALGLTSAWVGRVDAASALSAARFIATVVGAANVFLVGRLAQRWAGPLAALVAAALYAGYPEPAGLERGPFLEPVLNLACLAMAYAWLSPRPRRSALFAGVLCGVAMAVKVWGGIWLLAALLTVPAQERPWRFFLAASATWLALVLPLALLAPGSFLTEVLAFHAWRPPDGNIARLDRLPLIFGAGHGVSAALALLGLVLGALTRADRGVRELRFFAAVYALTVLAFLASSSYWSQYNAHLAASEAVLAGFGFSALWRRVGPRAPWLQRAPLAALAALALAFPSVRRAARIGGARAPNQSALSEALRRLAPEPACVFAFAPSWTLLGGRLPPHAPGVPVVVDSYATMLLGAVKGGARFADASAAFQSPASQVQVRAVLESCRFVVFGGRGAAQLSAESKAWFDAQFVKRYPPEGEPGIDLFERR